MQSARTDGLRERLLAARNPDGGWPYYAGRRSRIEPTCWAVLALSSGGGPDPAHIDGGVRFLGGRERDGLLVEAEAPGPNYGWNGLALFTALSASSQPAAWVGSLTTHLIEAKGVQLDLDPAVVRQDGQLQAWSWTPGTFSWVEPTAYCLLALKKAGRTGTTAQRIADGEAVLLDRVCEGGGWNYGNSQVLMQDLRPYVSTTALALLAMQDRPSDPIVQASVRWLVTHAIAERSAMALSLTAICLNVFGEPIDQVLESLAGQDERTGLLGNVQLVAMTLFALTLADRSGQAFAIR